MIAPRGATIAAVRVALAALVLLVVVAVTAATTVAALVSVDRAAVRTEEADVAEAKTKTLRITWIRSAIGFPKNQKATIAALGLHRLHETVEKPDNPAIRGQIFKVQHLLSVEE
jgi:large subunit ribosomal protein L30